MAVETKGITVKVDADLHAQIKDYIESHGMTMCYDFRLHILWNNMSKSRNGTMDISL